MLLKLVVKNYLLIHDLEIAFSGGFSVITGETGAGKSILLGALSLVLGQRADAGVLLDQGRKCVIEGVFGIGDYQMEDFFQDHSLDYDTNLILRREILENGKSRAFINDLPVNLTVLKELGERLVNIHSQHSVITLNDANFQLAVIDSYAGIQVKTQEYRVTYSRFAAAKTRLSSLEESEVRSAAELDYHRFMLDELNAARPVDGEPEELEQKLTLLNHAEEIRENLAKAGSALSGDEENLLGSLAAIIQMVNQAARFEPVIRTMAERLQSNYIDLKDLAGDILAEADRIETDPRLAEKLTQRLDLLNRLMKKHQVSDAGKLLHVREELEKKVNGAAGREEEIRMLKTELEGMEKDLQSRAAVLSKRRAGAIPGFEKEVTSLLEKLGIPRAQFRAELIDCQALSRDGLNRVSFLFSANKGIEMKDLGAAASGGELSRLMLAIKSMISQKNLLPTIIFDEIDNGVSGEVAGKVGSILRHMGSCMQVIAITHLPQIAAKGVRHYRVFKTEGKNTTHTYITEVEAGDRAVEIAKMLSDQRVTESAIKTANELLNN